MPSNDAGLEEEKDNDIIYSIITGSQFKIRPNDEKLAILKKGRPLFNINVMKRDAGRNSNRTFHSSWYGIHKWLCGSKNYNKLFCWPCLLMRPDTSSWCSIGNDDMKRFTSFAAKHARCKSHLKAICEYDETLSNFGLPLEFVGELKFKCKEEEEEEGNMSDKTEADEDVDSLHFQENEKKESLAEAKSSLKMNSSNVESSNNNSSTLKNDTKITFKAWQEMCKNNFPVSKSKIFEDFHLYKWKKKIAKQELKNSRLQGEKLKFEIQVLKAKLEYYKALKQNATIMDDRPSISGITSGIPDS